MTACDKGIGKTERVYHELVVHTDQQGAGLIDIITFKMRILSYYFDVVLPNQQMPSEHRAAFHETCTTI